MHIRKRPVAGIRPRRAAVVLVVALLAAACGEDEPPTSATRADAVAAYVELDDDRSIADDFVDPLTKARDGDPSSPAGFLHGLRSMDVVRDTSGKFVTRLIFQADATEADMWPDCVGEPDCDLVGDSPSLP